jgi:hypothetical protein
MNPGPWWGGVAVAAAYAVVIGSLILFVGLISAKRRKLQARRKELERTR